MRIAFVGKGGSGKTTLTALFSLWLLESTKNNIISIDADINMHLGELLGFNSEVFLIPHLSSDQSVKEIRTILKGENDKIKDLSHFKKTTSPGAGSHTINILDKDDPVIKNFSATNANLSYMLVGSYTSSDIGASCYHNNLSILENILSHTNDAQGVIVVDMVAGVDAFANTLHSQFDMLVLVIEPTRRSLEIYNHYQKLAQASGVGKSLFVIGNKVSSSEDIEFIQKHVPDHCLIGYFYSDDYLKKKDQEGGKLEISKIRRDNLELVNSIYKKLSVIKNDPQERLEKLRQLHRNYVSQGFVKDRFGDLSSQIDENFVL